MDLDSYVDYSLASRFLGFDIQRRSWSEEILEAANLRSDQLPIPVPAGTVAGRLDCEIARSLGVPPNTPVIVGGHDQPCAALGMGVIDEGRVSDSIGTYECTLASSDKPCLTDSALDASLNSFCHVVPEKFVTLAYFPSGLMVKWLHNLLYGPSANVNEEIPAEAAHYSVLEAGVREGPTGLCITPHLIGTGNPEFNANARGAIAGLTQDTTGSDLYKGVIEGLACELTMITQTLAKSVGDFRDMYVTGGGARSPLGLQLRAALTGCTLHVMKSPEAACLGTAILAGVAIGEFRDQNQAVRQTVHETAVIPPNPEIAACYVDQMDQYRTFRTAMTVRPRHSN
jgi:xylulokinase